MAQDTTAEDGLEVEVEAAESTPPQSADSVADLVDRQRVRQILKRRSQALDMLSRARLLQAESPNVGRNDVNQILEQSVRAYALELRPLMLQAAREDLTDRDYWRAYPSLAARFRVEDQQARPPDGEIGEAQVVTGSGVSFIRMHESPVRLEWVVEEEAPGRTSATRSERRQVTHTLPREVLMQVFEACDEFLAEIGLDLAVGDDMDRYELEYDDLL